MRYPAIDVLVDYAYNHRKLLDSMVATRLGSPVFRQEFLHDLSALIIDQKYAHGAAQPHQQHYWYDPAQRLVSWYLDGTSTTYEYDEVGSRQRTIRDNEPAEPYSYYSGTNRLQYRRRPDALGNDTLYTYGYDANGARTSQAVSYEQPTLSRLLREEYFGYSFRGLNNRARVRDYENGVPGPWEDWRYRYSANGEREQKRLYPYMDGVVPAPDSAIYPWCYNLLGGNKLQLAVYHGQHLDSLQSECGDFGKNRVYLYPFQYITYGASDAGAIITKPTGAREYKIADHLGSTRVVLDESGAVINQTDYEPFGATVAVTGIDTRKKFIDKEKDGETSLANHGVRQYDPETGSFTSIDPKWEKYPNQSPYNYSLNSPLVLVDGNGKNPLFALPLLEWLGLGAAAAGVVYVTLYVASEMRDEYGRFKFPSAPAVSTAVDVPIPSVLPTPDDAGRAFGILIAVLAMNSKEEGPIEPGEPAPAAPPSGVESSDEKTPLDMGKQGKHIPSHNNYLPGRSPLTHPDPQGLLDKWSGKGDPVGPMKKGTPGYKERVDFGEVIGEVNGQPTTKGIIHHSKTGAHIVPANP